SLAVDENVEHPLAWLCLRLRLDEAKCQLIPAVLERYRVAELPGPVMPIKQRIGRAFGLRAARGGEAFRRGLFFFAPDLSALAAKKEVVGAEAPAVARHVAGGHPAGSDMHPIAIERPAYRV